MEDPAAGCVDVETLLARPRPIGIRRKRPLYKAPEFVKRLEPFCEVDAGKDVVFECQWKAFPKPKITWFKDGANISQDARFDIKEGDNGALSLYIDHVTKKDEATYKCRTENEEGASSTTGYLAVKGDVKEKPLSAQPRQHTEHAVSNAPHLRAIVEQKSLEEREEEEYSYLPPSPLTDYIEDAMTRRDLHTWPFGGPLPAGIAFDPEAPAPLATEEDSGSDTSVDSQDYDHILLTVPQLNGHDVTSHNEDVTALTENNNTGHPLPDVLMNSTNRSDLKIYKYKDEQNHPDVDHNLSVLPMEVIDTRVTQPRTGTEGVSQVHGRAADNIPSVYNVRTLKRQPPVEAEIQRKVQSGLNLNHQSIESDINSDDCGVINDVKPGVAVQGVAGYPSEPPPPYKRPPPYPQKVIEQMKQTNQNESDTIMQEDARPESHLEQIELSVDGSNNVSCIPEEPPKTNNGISSDLAHTGNTNTSNGRVATGLTHSETARVPPTDQHASTRGASTMYTENTRVSEATRLSTDFNAHTSRGPSDVRQPVSNMAPFPWQFYLAMSSCSAFVGTTYDVFPIFYVLVISVISFISFYFLISSDKKRL